MFVPEGDMGESSCLMLLWQWPPDWEEYKKLRLELYPLEASLEADFDSEHLQNQQICHKKFPSEWEEKMKNKGPAAGLNQAANLQVDLSLNFAFFQSVKIHLFDLMIKLVKSKWLQVRTGSWLTIRVRSSSSPVSQLSTTFGFVHVFNLLSISISSSSSCKF